MRSLIDKEQLCLLYDAKLQAAGLDIDSPYTKLLIDTILDIPIEEQYYSERDMDYQIKINLALIQRFRHQLNEEFGTELIDTYNMFDVLYKEISKDMPDLWYNYVPCLTSDE